MSSVTPELSIVIPIRNEAPALRGPRPAPAGDSLQVQFRADGAFAAGFDHARGRLIVIADRGGQNDQRDVPAMVELGE